MKRVMRLPVGRNGWHGVLFSVLVVFFACTVDREAVTPTEVSVEQDGAASLTQTTTAAVEFVAATQNSANNGSSIAFSRPPGLQSGDVMIAQVGTFGTARVNTPSGWTLVRGDYNGTHSNSYVYWRRATDSEPSSYSWTTSTSSRLAGGIAAYRNVEPSGSPIDVHGGQHTASSTSIVAPSVTTTVAGAYLVAVFSAASEKKETNLSFSPPGGMAERYGLSSKMGGNSQNVVVMHASAPLGASGATGTRTARLAVSRPGWGQLIALKPGPASSSPSNRPPVARAGGPYTANEGSALALDGSGSSDPDGDALTYSWSYGDGNSGSGAKPSHTYRDNGTYTVVLTVTDPHGATSRDSTAATIANVAPTATLSLSAGTVAVGQTVTATGSFTDAGAADSPWSWEIDWGDGTKQTGSVTSTSASLTGSRAYTSAGSYTVRLSVTDKDGGRGSAQQSLSVSSTTTPSERYTDFSEYTTGQRPADWSYPYTASTYLVEARAGTTGGKVLYNSVSGTAYHVLRWDAVGTPADVELETVVRVVSGSTYNESMALIARGAAGAHTFYSSRLDSGTGAWTLARYNSGASAALATWANPFPIGTWVRHRFRVEGSTLRVKIWRADSAEPTNWTMQATESAPLGGGFAGVWMRRGGAINEFDWIRVTTLSGGSPDPTPPAPAVAWVWSGGQTATGATVKTRLTGASTDVRVRVSTDSLFRTFSETATTSTAGNDVATFTLSSLAANTRYHYRVVVGATEDAAKQGAFHTFPAVGSAHSFTFAMGSCQRTDTNKPVFTHVRATNPRFWLQTGDIHYRNIAVNDIDQFRFAYNRLHDQSNQAALFRSTAIVHIWDDHDGAGGNDTDRTRTGWPAARAAYRENLPHHALPAGTNGAIYQSFVVGRVRFIVTDMRSERSPMTQTDDANKTMLGAAQKQYLKDQLAAAKANRQFIAWVSTIPWIAARTTGADHWGGYSTERQEIATYIADLGVAGQMFLLSGDMHATAMDSGVNNAWGGFPVFNAGPIDQNESVKGGPYSHGPFTNGSLGEQFGVVTVTDNGGSSITVSFSGRRNGQQITGAFHQFTLTLP